MAYGREALPDLITEALAQHPSIDIALSGVEAAGAELNAAEWGRFPTVSLSAEAENHRDGQLVGRIEQPLWSGGRITGQIDASTAEQRRSLAELEEARLALMQRTAEVFYEILRLTARIDAARESEGELRNLLGMIQRRAAADINPAADELLAATRLNQASSERTAFQRELSVMQGQFRSILGRTVGELEPPPDLTLETETIQRLEGAATAFSPSREQLLADMERSEADIKLARAESRPTLVLGYRHTEGGDTEFEDQAGGQAYIALQVQTGAGLSSRSVVRAARMRHASASAALRDHDRELMQTIYSLWTQANSIELQLTPARAVLAGADKMVDSYLRQFQVGRKSWLDVLNVQREKTQARYSLADLESPLALTRTRLLLLSGAVTHSNLELLHGN